MAYYRAVQLLSMSPNPKHTRPMQKPPRPLIQRLNNWQFNAFVVAASLILTNGVVGMVELLMYGQISARTLPIASVSGLIIATLVVSGTTFLRARASKNIRRELESGIERAHGNLALAVETAQMLFWELDMTTGTVSLTQENLPWLGMEANVEINSLQAWLDLIHPQDIAPFMQRFQEGMPPGSPDFEMDYRVQNGQGQWGWVHTRGRVTLRDAQGVPQRAVGGSLNITQRKKAQEALQEHELLLTEVQRVGHIGSYVLNLETDAWVSSTVLDQILGIEAEAEKTTVSWHALVHPDDRPMMLDYLLHEVIEPRQPFNREYRVVRGSDGSTRWVWGCGELSLNPEGTPIKMIGTIQDITERKQIEVRQKLAASVFTHAREGITITDLAGDIIDVNDMFTQITGYSRDEVLGKNPRILQSGRQDKAFYVALWHELTTQGHWSGEVWNRRKNGEVYAEILTISAVRDDAGATQHYVALFSDISAIKAHQSELERMAHFDTLTGLPNRLLLGDRLQQSIAQCQRRDQGLAVVFLDLDNIKTVNDTHGHEAGDAVLTAVSKTMQEALREGDTLARIGGDEFVAVLVDLDQSRDCIPVIERLLAAAATPVKLPASTNDEGTQSDQSVRVSASIGVTLYPQDDVDADVLLRHADQAMYLAKQAGKSRYHLFDIANDAAIQSRYQEIRRIREALDHGEFVLYYQPKVHMRTGDVMGAEALIRWQHPERGLLPPGAFLPLIEEHPISVELGEWVIATALAQMSAWQAQGLDLPVSVNLGALQLQQRDFPERLRDILAAHPEAAPQRLQLEILETSAFEDIDQAMAAMHACLALGVTFALDDFGTGYSSLTYLKHLPAETLKIDQSFIRNMTNSADDLAIVEGVIGLAEVFQRQVIAEGVETQMLGDMLLSIGCDLAQGYGVARPMPAQEMPGWALKWKMEASWTA